MKISNKNLKMLFSDIRSNQSALLLGQDYFKKDADFFKRVLINLGVKEGLSTMNQIWESTLSFPKDLGNAILKSTETATVYPWFKTIIRLGWNIVLTSSTNTEWMKKNVGSDFGLDIQNGNEISSNDNIYKISDKKNLKLISLFGDENCVPPDTKSLNKLKRNTALYQNIYNQMLSNYGVFILDGISSDDWFDVKRLLENVDDIPCYECVYIFGMTSERLETIVSKNDWELFEDCISQKQICLDERSLIDILYELDMIIDDDFEDNDHENEVCITLRDNDSLWIPKKECIKMKNMGITIMRDEILSQLFIDDTNKQKYFADYLQQRDEKNWKFFDVIYKKENISFHVPRDVEGLMESAVSSQLNNFEDNQSIILLKGQSNSGKTTSLSWFAWHLQKEGIKKNPHSKYVIFYISGTPSSYDKDWQEMLRSFIKKYIKDAKTSNGQRIHSSIIIWDNYGSKNKKTDYVELYKNLNECNVILVGSAYPFESLGKKIVQGISFNELKPLDVNLEAGAYQKWNALLRKINPGWVSVQGDGHLFDSVMKFAQFNYSPEWQAIRNLMRGRLINEAEQVEDSTNELYQLFVENNPEDFINVKKVVYGLGIGKVIQASYLELSEEQRQKNKLLINSIRKMNFILAVAGQFNNSPAIPMSVLIRTISDGKQYQGDYKKLNYILKNDAMIKYDNNRYTGNTLISFRHPSEAKAYLDSVCTLDERKDREIEVLKTLIEYCNWHEDEEARSIATLIRAFGTNSYGKFGEQNNTRGGYAEYCDYWQEIINALRTYASGNAEAMLILGHFTRDNVLNSDWKFKLKQLEDVCEIMLDAAEKTEKETAPSTLARLYGEICRNLLERIKTIRNHNDVDTQILNDLYESFVNYFKDSVSASGISNGKVSTIHLLDIWLNFINNIEPDYAEMRKADTLDYIEQLFYSKTDIIAEDDDCSNIVSNIDNIYKNIAEMSMDDIKRVFEKSNNDSYVYCMAKQVLIKAYLKYIENFGGLSNDDSIISNRIFFLNENAAEDFSDKEQFEKIKELLKEASSEVINILTNECKTLNNMSYRCALLYLKAKWMCYTGCLVLETGQKPHLRDAEWTEFYEICRVCRAKRHDNDIESRAVSFLESVYTWVYMDGSWPSQRIRTDINKRILCLCRYDKNTNDFVVRSVRVSVKVNENKKMFAKIDREMIQGIPDHKSRLLRRTGIYVPENIRDYDEIKRANLNISRDFAIWFNLGGPQLQDYN